MPCEPVVQLDRPAFDGGELERALSVDLPGAVEVVVTDPGTMRVLNSRFRHVDRPAEVLSFDLSEPGGAFPEGTVYVNGRLAPPLSRLLHRIAHGYLHLSGYTHHEEETHARMEEETGRILDLMLERAEGGGGV